LKWQPELKVKKLATKYTANFLSFELILAVIAVIILITIIAITGNKDHLIQFLNGNRQGLYTVLASIAGALFGFVITAVSIIMVFMQNERLKLVRESRHHETVYRVFFSTIRYLAFATIWSIIALLIDTDSTPKTWVFYIELFALIVVAMRMARCIWVMEKVINLAVKKS